MENQKRRPKPLPHIYLGKVKKNDGSGEIAKYVIRCQVHLKKKSYKNPIVRNRNGYLRDIAGTNYKMRIFEITFREKDDSDKEKFHFEKFELLAKDKDPREIKFKIVTNIPETPGEGGTSSGSYEDADEEE